MRQYGRSYAVVNPDPPSASTLTSRMQEGSVLSFAQSAAGDVEDNASQPESDALSPGTAAASEGDPNANGGLSPLTPSPPIAPPTAYTPYRPGSVFSAASADPAAGN